MNLIELFNPTFFVYLGILLLIVSIMVYYYEGKMREQNHKISSMLSLVSSMAEELNLVRHNMNSIVMNAGMNVANNQTLSHMNNENNRLIPVSDDSSSESASNDDNESDDDNLSDDDNDNESDEHDTTDVESNSESESEESDNEIETLQNLKIGDKIDTNDVKILNIHLGDNLDELCEVSTDGNADDIELDDLDELDELDESSDNEIHAENLDDNETNDDNENNNHSEVEKTLNDTTNNNDSTQNNNDIFNLKSINIDGLDESKSHENNDELDYKKLSIGKLRAIVVEKGLTQDASKLNKNKILKMLGEE